MFLNFFFLLNENDETIFFYNSLTIRENSKEYSSKQKMNNLLTDSIGFPPKSTNIIQFRAELNNPKKRSQP